VNNPKPCLDDEDHNAGRRVLHARDRGSSASRNAATLFGRQTGLRVYGWGALALGTVGAVWGDFALVWQPVPSDVPGRKVLAYIVAGALLLAGAAVQWKRTARAGTLGLIGLYALCVILLHVPRVVARPSALSSWAGVTEQLALVAGGLVGYAIAVGIKGGASERVAGFARNIFAACVIVFGMVHFSYVDDTASLVPTWLPPGPAFWAYGTGVADCAAGLAILTGILASTAARLLTLMFIVFGVLVHARSVFIDPNNHLNWTANAMNLALIGAAWLIADSIEARSTGRR